MGNQQRSGLTTIEGIGDIRDGIIGTPYLGKAWYSNRRGSIGTGKEIPVPEWLDWELFQGPAPRKAYRDNIVHYNWHWFWNWGTGEINNNGTHEIDICRWALGVDYPVEVTSSGGRYHYNDDWEFYDTQSMTFEFGDEASITWEGRSCNPLPHHERGRGASIHGTEGSVVLDRNGYIIYDMDNNEVDRNTADGDGDSGLGIRAGGSMTDRHARNFVQAIRDGSKLNAPIDEGHKSVLLCHLGNITQYTGDALHLDPSNGHIVGNRKAEEMWSRDYEPGWEPTV
jgi:predicted dehydrogenase